MDRRGLEIELARFIEKRTGTDYVCVMLSTDGDIDVWVAQEGAYLSDTQVMEFLAKFLLTHYEGAEQKEPAAEKSPVAWVIVADGEVDQICGSAEETLRELRDLNSMGCEVCVHEFDSLEDAEAFGDRLKGEDG